MAWKRIRGKIAWEEKKARKALMYSCVAWRGGEMGEERGLYSRRCPSHDMGLLMDGWMDVLLDTRAFATLYPIRAAEKACGTLATHRIMLILKIISLRSFF